MLLARKMEVLVAAHGIAQLTLGRHAIASSNCLFGSFLCHARPKRVDAGERAQLGNTLGARSFILGKD
jgi:hypothetical protein